MVNKKISALFVVALLAGVQLQSAEYKDRELTRTSHRLFILEADCETAFELSCHLAREQFIEQANQHAKSVEMCSREYVEIGLQEIKGKLGGADFAEVLPLVKKKRAARAKLNEKPNSEKRKSYFKSLVRQLKRHPHREKYLKLKRSQRFLNAVLIFEAEQRKVRAACGAAAKRARMMEGVSDDNK